MTRLLWRMNPDRRSRLGLFAAAAVPLILEIESVDIHHINQRLTHLDSFNSSFSQPLRDLCTIKTDESTTKLGYDHGDFFTNPQKTARLNILDKKPA